MSNPFISRDPDDLHGDEPVAVLTLTVRRNGAMSVAGCINNEVYALAMLDNARDCIKRHNRGLGFGDVPIITPACDAPSVQ
jgi:hypothetical protein